MQPLNLSDSEKTKCLKECDQHFAKAIRFYEYTFYLLPFLCVAILFGLDTLVVDAESELSTYKHLFMVIGVYLVMVFSIMHLYKKYYSQKHRQALDQACLFFYDAKNRPFVLTPTQHMTTARLLGPTLKDNCDISDIQYEDSERLLNIFTTRRSYSRRTMASSTSLELAQVYLPTSLDEAQIQKLIAALNENKKG